jgi:undecaprenyl pyrophosphate phosphatase UppP
MAFVFALDAMPNTFFWGIPIGLVLGVGSWIYLSRIWDPAELRFKKAKKANQREWMSIAYIIFLVLLRTVLVTYTENGDMLLASALTFWFISTGLYMIFQAWRHRPK